MRPRPIELTDIDYWRDVNPLMRTFTAPGEIEAGVQPCDGLVTDDQMGNQFGEVVRVPWVIDDDELTKLTETRTLWLSTWGGLPMHMLEVQEPNSET